jgi:hypothetical protein
MDFEKHLGSTPLNIYRRKKKEIRKRILENDITHLGRTNFPSVSQDDCNAALPLKSRITALIFSKFLIMSFRRFTNVTNEVNFGAMEVVDCVRK